ncbi:MAG: hypothetical protein GEV28_21200 [Actinophytocola sp.]|uniref:hypothetical protein n=1 Tax=Actinophytocola sp. TaxID=1872138 RepID=UPI0013295CB2|nr:hypothetical protein [Actinophytocola sp.]MPZ82779.1 hypothetical protein [Actinophytocola sp.]
MNASHRWETTSSHVTSDGWVRYQRCGCGCGATRVLLNTEPVSVEPIGTAVRNDRRNDRERSGVVDER